MKLQDKVILITGGASGIGLAITQKLTSLGAQIVVCGRRPEQLQSLGGKILTYKADVSRDDQVQELMSFVSKRCGHLDVLINNAGVLLTEGVLEQIALQDWDTTLSINLTGAFLSCKYALPLLKQRPEAAIVNIASMLALYPYKGMHAYCASKAALVALTKSLGQELEGSSVKTWCLCPGATNTPMLAASIGIEAAQSAPPASMVADLCARTLSSPIRPKNGKIIPVRTGPWPLSQIATFFDLL